LVTTVDFPTVGPVTKIVTKTERKNKMPQIILFKDTSLVILEEKLNLFLERWRVSDIKDIKLIQSGEDYTAMILYDSGINPEKADA
jgi:hypothetical protein